MINNFKRIFGDDKEVVVCFGDFEQKRHAHEIQGANQRKRHENFIDIRKAGFQTYLVFIFTSK